MKVYHGSYMAVEMPKILKSKFPKDFGEGFYCTELVEQAERWAKTHINDVPNIIKKAETFRILCPDYADFNIYLGFASLSFYKELEQECIEHGIAIIKQIGDTVVINDAHLKVY